MKFKRLADIGVEGKRVLIREDLNVPIADGVITSDARIRAALPTIEQCVAQGAAVIVMSHLGRPEEGVYDDALSLAPIGAYLSEALGQQVDVVKNWRDGLAVEPLKVSDGFITVPRKPGLGIEVDEEVVRKYAVP